jgi:glycogen operon protein
MGSDSRTLAYCLCGAAQQDADLYVMINASDSDRTFEIQEGLPGQWRLAFDTGLASPDDFCDWAKCNCIQSLSYVVRARSIAGMTRLIEPSLSRGS